MDSSKRNNSFNMSGSDWFLTVIRTQGMRLMRSDREWRPVVTVDICDLHPHRQHGIEHHHEHELRTNQPQVFETLMGVDGQNPNLKHGLYIPGPIPSSSPSPTPSASPSTLTLNTITNIRPSPALTARLSIGVWYTPPAHGKRKVKTKKRVLVGSAELSVGELLKMWEKERGKGRGALDLRLTCHSPTKGSVSSRNGAVLTVRLHPPPPLKPPVIPDPTDTETESEVEVRDAEGGIPRTYSSTDEGNDLTSEVEGSIPSPIPPSSQTQYTIATPTPTPTSTSPTLSPTPSLSSPFTEPSSSVPTPTPSSQLKLAPDGLRRRRRNRKPKVEFKGYAIDSDPCLSPSSPSSRSSSSCEPHSEEEDEYEKERARFIERWCNDEDAGTHHGHERLESWCPPEVDTKAQEDSVGWISASLLPQHTLQRGKEAGPSSGRAGVLENEAAAAWRAQMRSASMNATLIGREVGEDEKVALPAYTEKVQVEDPDALTLPERVLATFTLYAALRAARLDSEFEAVFTRLQMEWGYVGGLLVALAAVNTAVLSISPDSVFTVHEYARGAIAASSVASGLGIACDTWFLLRYAWADVAVVRIRAQDVFNTYFFFALSARTPSMCMFVSALSLMTFLALVAFDAWPGGALVVCGLVGALMGLQFLVWGVVWVGRGVKGGVRGVGRGVRGVVGVVSVKSGLAARGRMGASGAGEKGGC